MHLQQTFEHFIKEHQLFDQQNGLLIAVSGGLDSVVLCHLCAQARYSFAIAHCNFRLRGEESDRDEAFVQQLARAYHVPFHIKRFDTEAYAAENKCSIQVAARELRYHWFEELLNDSLAQKEQKLNRILTAHHLDDNIETVMMNFFKGTGIAGLRGIKPRSGRLVRPLLFASKEDLLQFANSNGLKWVEDSSNNQQKYTRNYFRLELLPALEKVFPSVKENLADNIQRFTEAELLYEQAVSVHKTKLLEHKGEDVYIPVLKLQKSVPLRTIVFEIIKAYGFTQKQVPEVIKLLESESGKYITSPSHRILKNRSWLIISPLQSHESNLIVIEKDTSEVSYNSKKLQLKSIKKNAFAIDPNPSIAFLDQTEIRFPLLLRKWKEGDYFYPLGMRKKKKLSRFFIDTKLSIKDKEDVWVLESNKRIVWIIGYRIDDRFKITEKTNKILQITTSSL